MKTMQISLILLATILLLQGNLIAQTFFEDFEDEVSGSSTFTSEGQEFLIGGGAETFDILNLSLGGWDGQGNPDDFFIDNTGAGAVPNDGSNLVITTAEGTDITIKSLFLFMATRALGQPEPFALIIEGIRDGEVLYTIVKTDGFSDISTFEPNSGYTFIDFATEGEEDFSNIDVDEINIQTTGNSDYMGLDAFTWGPASLLSTGDFSLNENNITVSPNPAINAITVSGVTERENYRIYNVLGAEISKGSISNNEAINIQDLSNGLYLINFDNGNNVKFLKE